MKRKLTPTSLSDNKKLKLEFNLINIFKDTLLLYLSGYEIVKCSLVSKDWHKEIYKNETLWKQVVTNECGYVKKLIDYNNSSSFYNIYRLFYENVKLNNVDVLDSKIEGI